MPTNRLTVDLNPSDYELFIKHIHHGMRGEVVRIVLRDLLELCEKHGAGKVIGALIERSIHVRDVCKLKEDLR